MVDTVVRSHGRWVANSFLNYRRDAIAKKAIDLELDFSSSIQADHPNQDEDKDEGNPNPNPRQVHTVQENQLFLPDKSSSHLDRSSTSDSITLPYPTLFSQSYHRLRAL